MRHRTPVQPVPEEAPVRSPEPSAANQAPASIPPGVLTPLLKRLRKLVWTPPSGVAADTEQAVIDAVRAYHNLAPTTAEEALVVERIVLARAAADTCLWLSRVNLVSNLTDSTTYADLHRKFSAELLTWQRELAKARGRPHQSVQVQHVHVADGAQAVVGNVQVDQTDKRGRSGQKVVDLRDVSKGSRHDTPAND